MHPLIKQFVQKSFRKLGYTLLTTRSLGYGFSLLDDVRKLAHEMHVEMSSICDIGANTGQFACEALRAFPGACVHCVEPHPVAFERLSKSLSVPNVFTHQTAIGDHEGVASLYVYGTDEEASTINSLTPNAGFARAFAGTPREIQVPCTTLDAFLQKTGLDRVDLLKVDTEGFDLVVLKSGSQAFANGRVRFVVVEFNDVVQRKSVSGGGLAPIADYLADYGFRFAASYNDFIRTTPPWFMVADALFVHFPT